MLLLIENGEVYAPEPRGRQAVLVWDGKVVRMGGIDSRGAREAAETLGGELEVIDASGCLVVPGFVDPHMHLTGGSGEEGFASRTPDLQLTEIVPWGTTTVVGVLGVDATTRTLPGLLAKVRGLNEEGMTAFLYTGHYEVPPVTFTDSVRNDLLLIREVIGVGEIAISDHRAVQPDVRELARLVVDAHVGGMLSGKAGITHFHLGEIPDRLSPLRALIDDLHVAPELLYPSHVQRTPELLAEAVELAKRGSFVDMDSAEEGLGGCIRSFLDQGGPAARLTLSSDADSTAPKRLFEQVRAAVLEDGLPLEQVLPLVTANPACILKLQGKGKIEPGADADLVVLRKESLEIVDVIARGKLMVRRGEVVQRESYLEESDRILVLEGKK
ncbi:MAG TPA: beta-aspartyl-peptidase [Thermoanaerobaculia bacterium]|nr:beta-aspartyl-peptidase [Thermoanaerobaculia bacterium]